MRGGTSKGVYCRLPDLPRAELERDAFVLALLGSPDPMQLDGLGGTHSSTSKLMAVGTTDEARTVGWKVATDDVDIAYAFAQVGVADPIVDWTGNCGNLTAAVAPYAILRRLVKATDPKTVVRMLNLNTGVVIEAKVPTEDYQPVAEGDFIMPGVPGSGARIDIRFYNPAGGSSGRPVFPTGERTETLVADSHQYEVSILDISSPVVFVAARSVGLTGTELPADMNKDFDLLARLDAIRRAGALRIGLTPDVESAAALLPGAPRVIVVSSAQDHISALGDPIKAEDCDLLVRMTSIGVVHHAFPGTGLTTVAVAVRLAGTVAHAMTSAVGGNLIRLAHPKGVVVVGSEVDDTGPVPTVSYVEVSRTARELMTGIAYPRI
jgi:hypothetical protein